MALGRLNHLAALRLSSSYRVLTSARFTSAGPPPAPPVNESSLRYKYEKFLDRWPKVAALNKMVFEGSRWCIDDIKTYIKLRRRLSSGQTTVSNLSTPELEVLVQTPSESLKAIAIIVLLPLPATFYLIGFCVIFFPRVVLTRHFWSDEQRKEYFAIDIRKSNTALTDLHAALYQPKSLGDAKLNKVEDISGELLRSVCKLQGMLPLPFSKKRLTNRVQLLRQLDSTLPTYVDTLTTRQLIFHMYIRRLDYSDLTDNQMREKLVKWLKFTTPLNDGAYLVAPAYFNTYRD